MNKNILDKNIFCFWTGNNKMSTRRLECLEKLKKVSECNVILVTPETLDNYILSEHPLHQSYKYLSLTHKADYLRTYFMRFHGGGYSDIKKTTGSWIESFEKLNKSDKWIIGYKERKMGAVWQIRDKWMYLVGNGAYICKPNTPFVIEWYEKMIQLMDEKYDELKKNPAKWARDCKERKKGYPIAWNEMLGRIFHPTVYKYREKRLNTLPISIFQGYR